MSLNDLSLNPHLISQLYAHSLLAADQNDASSKTGKEAPQPQEQEENNTPALQNYPVLKASVLEPGVQVTSNPSVTLPPPTSVAEQPVAYGNAPSLGGNKRGVLILVKNETVPFLPDADLEFLSAILSACRLSIADVAIVNLHHYPQSYTALLEQFTAQQVLLMGVTPQEVDLPFHFPHFQLQPFDGRTYLSAYPLAQMAQDRSLKMQLWGCLKQLFGV